MGAADDSLMSSLVTQQSEGVCSPPSIDSAYASVMPTDERIPSSDPQLYNNALQEEIIRLRYSYYIMLFLSECHMIFM